MTSKPAGAAAKSRNLRNPATTGVKSAADEDGQRAQLTIAEEIEAMTDPSFMTYGPRTRAEFIETMELMARGDVKPVVGRRVHFTHVEALFEDIIKQRLLGRGALTYEG